MIGTRGKYKDRELKLYQFANNWLSVDDPDGKAAIVNPVSVVLDPEEVAHLRFHEQQPKLRASAGSFFDQYEVHDDGRITRR